MDEPNRNNPFKIKPLKEQIEILRNRIHADLGKNDKKFQRRPLPLGADGWFAVPRWQALSSSKGGATGRLFLAFRDNLRCAHRALDFKHRENDICTDAVFEELCRQQEGNEVLVVPARYRFSNGSGSTYPPRKKKKGNIDQKSVFFLDTFSVGAILLTHLTNLGDYRGLIVPCSNEVFTSNGHSPNFQILDGYVSFGSVWFDSSTFHESPIGFLP